MPDENIKSFGNSLLTLNGDFLWLDLISNKYFEIK